MKNLLLILLLFSFEVKAQDYSKEIEKHTSEYRELFLAKNYSSLADLASPKLIEYLKTKQDLIYLLTELDRNFELKGGRITNITFEKNSEIFDYKNQLQCSVLFRLEMEDQVRRVIFDAGLALTSFDQGKTWYFAFRVEKDQELNNKVLDLDDRIVVRIRTQSVVNK